MASVKLSNSKTMPIDYDVPTKTDGVKYSVFPPETMANPHPETFLCEIRESGWIMDCQRFETVEQARIWGFNHDGKMSNAIAATYAQIVEEKERGL